MPALYLFNRRTLLAGDDLQLPSLAWGFVSLVQLFLFLPYLVLCTVDILLLSSAEYDVGGGNRLTLSKRFGFKPNNNSLWEAESYHRRQRDDFDDYFEHLESGIPTMNSSSCLDATSEYSDLKFPYLILVYLTGMTIYCASSLCYEQRIFQVSSRGTPTTDIDLRAPVGKLIEFKMTVLAGINIILLLYGLLCSLLYINDYIQCFPTFWWIAWFVLLATQGLQFLLTLTTLVSLWKVTPVSSVTVINDATARLHETGWNASSLDFYHRHVDHLHSHNNTEMVEEMWRNRCEGCCKALALSTCFLFGGQSIVSHASNGGGEKFYGDIARALADYFADFGDGTVGQRGLDVVPSDVALGFLILRHIQAQRKLLARRDALQQTHFSGSRSGSYNDVKSTHGNGLNQNLNRTTLLFRWSTRSLERSTAGEGENDSSSTQEVANVGSVSQEEESYQTFSRIILSPSNPDDVAVLREGARFARHQLAIYTWILYYYMHPVSGTFRLIGQSLREKLNCSKSNEGERHGGRPMGSTYERCSINPDVEAGIIGSNFSGKIKNGTIIGDNFLHLHETTMLAHAGLDKSDIVYASFEAGFYETPYCIVIDRKWRTIVLAIRGSLTLEDCVVDVLLDPIPLDSLGESYGFSGSGQYCHGGVLECTHWLHADLMRYVTKCSPFFSLA